MSELAASVTDLSTRARARANTTARQPPVAEPTPLTNDPEAQRIADFGKAIEALRSEIEAGGVSRCAVHPTIDKLSRRLEVLGRGLIHVSLDPLTFGVGTAALTAHKLLELMEIGHMALHGAYDGLPDAKRFQSEGFHWKAPIDEASWKQGHNVRHHQYTNIEGKDPDLNFGALRLSPRVPYRTAHALQPTRTAHRFGYDRDQLHVTAAGCLPQQASPRCPDPSPRRCDRPGTFFSKWLRY